MKKLLSVTLAAGLLLSAGGEVFAATGNDVVNTGSKYLGTPYQYGAPLGNTSSFDCSSFTVKAFADAGIKLARTTAGQVVQGTPVSKNNLRVGDLVFFKTTSSYVGHVGIYVGNGKMIGSQSSTGVAIVSMNNSYWGPRYVTARRVADGAAAPAVKQAANKSTPAKTVAKAAPTVPNGTYAVKRGDTLWAISSKYSTSVASLKRLNGLKSDMIYVGQKLKVSGKAPVVKPSTAKSPVASKGKYTIKRGDTLWGISHKHGVSLYKLKSANSLKSHLIYPGKTLVIPK